MVRLIMSCGPMLWPMVFVTLLIGLTTVVAAIQLIQDRRGLRVRGSINAILAGGVVVALMGFLGQAVGLYKAATVVAHARVISPGKVFMGFAESIQTSILGLAVLIGATLIWLVLDVVWRLRSETPAA